MFDKNFVRSLLVAFSLLLPGAIQNLHAQSYALTNLWSVAPYAASHPYMDTNHMTRGMAYDPVTGNVLVASRTGSNAVHVLNGTTGAKIGHLPYDTNVVWGGTFHVNLVGVADDGVIYVSNLTTDSTNTTASTGPLRVYRWSNASAQPQLAYSGDPTEVNTVGTFPRRVGDSMIVRGAGTNTQILLGSYTQFAYLLTTTDGTNFTSRKITTDAAASDLRWGIAWGTNNTFWAKQSGKDLKQFNLDLDANTATTIKTVSAPLASITGGPIALDFERNLFAVVDTTSHRLRVYDISVLNDILQQDTTKSFPGNFANGNFTGAIALRDGKLFALESNNGLLGYTIHEVYLPPTIATAPANVTLWDGADNWTFSAVIAGTRPFTFQWQFNGVDIPNATSATLTISNITSASAGGYSITASNPQGSATSPEAQLTVVPSNASDRMTNVWSIVPDVRPYLTSGYKEYGVAINPVNTNVIVLTRANPTNMLVVLDGFTGAEKHYIDYSGLTMSGGTPMNKVDIADDGAIYIANYTSTPGTVPFTILGIGSDVPSTSDKWIAYSGNPGSSLAAGDNQWGRTLSVRGGGLNTELLVGSASSSARAVAIFRPDANYAFSPTIITVPDAPAGFCRLGIAWGDGNTFWAKTVGSLILVEYDLGTGTGFVRKSYPVTGLRSVPSSVTGISYDPATKLLTGLQNGTAIRPVSIPLYDLSNIDAGPLEVDLELFTTHNPDIEYQGQTDFAVGYVAALGENNGLKMMKINTGAVNLPRIITHPVSGTHYTTTSPTLTVVADSDSALSYQWYFEGTPIANATESTLTLTNIQLANAGNYFVRVSNAVGHRDSAVAVISVNEVFNTTASTNVWTLQPGSRFYISSNYTQYGMAYNPASSNVLVVSLDGGTIIAALDALNGQEKNFLDVTGISGGTKVLHKIDVADDGVVYAANLTTAAGTNPLKLYRWSNDGAGTVPTLAFSDDPGTGATANGGWGYTLNVRGAGAATEILMAMSSGAVVSVLKTADGSTFTANPIAVAGAPSGFARLGLAFGEGNTFWAKTAYGLLYLVQYDLGSQTGTILKTYPTTQVPGVLTALDYDAGRKFLGGIANETPKNVRLYNAADIETGPQWLDQELFPTTNPSIEWNGELDFGGDYLFALDQNNGLHAYLLNNSISTSFSVVGITAANGTVTIQWQAKSGTTYQVQYQDSLGGTWQPVGSPVTANSSSASFVDTVPNGVTKRFYRVLAQ